MNSNGFRKLSSRRNASYTQSLIRGIKAKDSNAFASFYSLTADQVYRDFYGELGNTYVVQDCVSALYILFYRSLGNVETAEDAAETLSRLERDILSSVKANRVVKRKDPSPRPRMLEKESDIMLSDLLDRLRLPENTIPLEFIKEFDVYRGRKTYAFRWLVAVAALALLLIPLLLLDPKATLSMADKVSPFTNMPAYTLNVSSVLPVKSVVATINGDPVPVMQEDKDTYTLLPRENGVMIVTVRSLGRGSVKESIAADVSDTSVPQMTGTAAEDGKLIIYLSDTGSGVNYSRISAHDEDGNEISYLSYDEKNGSVTFNYPDSTLYVDVPDNSGNVLNLKLDK